MRNTRAEWNPPTYTLQIILLLLQIVLFSFTAYPYYQSWYSTFIPGQYPKSPADPAIRHHLRYFSKYDFVASKFAQEPGPELDAAWHDLLKGMNIRVSASDLSPYHAHSVKLADGSGHVAQLGVYHELHCLKKIKHLLHASHYHGNLSAGALAEATQHVEHCLEWLRAGATCRSDVTLATLQWDATTKSRLETEYPVPRRCVDFEGVRRWAEARSVDVGAPGVVEGPGLG